ncbi:hypothetical protein GCM10027033_02770 [Leucobacter ruminantium]
MTGSEPQGDYGGYSAQGAGEPGGRAPGEQGTPVHGGPVAPHLDEASVPAPIVRKRGASPLVIGLAVACGVLLLATIGFGGAAAWLWNERAKADTALAAAEKELADLDVGTTQTLGDLELVIVSDISFSEFVRTAPDSQGLLALYSHVTNEDAEQAAEVFFDLTAYDADGRVIGRNPASMYLLPEQQSIFKGIISSDMLAAEMIKIEQTSLEFATPAMTGGIAVDGFAGSDSGYVEGEFTSSLSQAVQYPYLYIVGYVDDEIFAVCSDWPDVPANGAFTASCRLDYAANDEVPEGDVKIPEDAEFDAFLALDIPY